MENEIFLFGNIRCGTPKYNEPFCWGKELFLQPPYVFVFTGKEGVCGVKPKAQDSLPCLGGVTLLQLLIRKQGVRSS